MKKHIVFDFDDTIAASFDFNQSIFVEVVKTLAPDADEDIIRLIHGASRGTPMKSQFAKVKKQLQLSPSVSEFVELNKKLQSENFTKVKLFAGFPEVLNHLNKLGRIISICSNRDIKSLNSVLKYNKIDQYFDNVISCEEAGHEKPDPFCLNELKQKYYEIPSSDFIYFGDSQTDAKFASAAEIDHLIIDHYLNNNTFYSVILDVMTGEEDEMLVRVDENNKETGVVAKLEAHSGLRILHRAAVIVIFRSNGKVVLGKRAARKMLRPNQWDFSAGHQPLGLTMIQTAKMELREEFGLKSKVILHSKFLKEEPKEHEFEYLYYTISDDTVKLEPLETSEYQEFDCQKLLNGEYDRDYDFVPRVKERLLKLKDVWSKI